MFVGVGVGAYVAGVFHLLTHAFFKAGLFLAAGSVMHAMSGSGDITKMGGLRKKLPLTHGSFVVYWLAICGIVPFAGFFSKDEILAGAFFAEAQGWAPAYGKFLWAVLSLAALGTAFYMSRLYFLVFSGKLRADEETKAHIHESPGSMTGPLLILAVCTLLVGFIGLPHLESVHLPTLLHDWLSPSLARPELASDFPAMAQSIGMAGHHGDATILGLMGLALFLGAAGIGLAAMHYRDGVSAWVTSFTSRGIGATLYKLSYNKFYVDEIYDVILVRPFRWLANGFFEFVDRFVIDLIFVNGAALVIDVLGRIGRWFQNGQVHRYLIAVLLGAAAIFFFTDSMLRADFSYREEAGVMRFKVEVGEGPAMMSGGSIRWDLDGDGEPDRVPVPAGATGEPGYVEGPSVEIDAREVGGTVTMWYTDPVFGSTRTVVKPMTGMAQGTPAAEQGGAQ
jgi:NADH-quinone oxidoreductase subunit L